MSKFWENIFKLPAEVSEKITELTQYDAELSAATTFIEDSKSLIDEGKPAGPVSIGASIDGHEGFLDLSWRPAGTPISQQGAPAVVPTPAPGSSTDPNNPHPDQKNGA